MYHIENERIISFVATELLPKRKKEEKFAPRLNAKNFKLGPVQTPMGPLAGRVTGSIS